MASGSEKLDWAKCKEAFCDDEGSLRDIYVFDTGLDDWTLMLQLLKRKLYGMTFFLDGEVSTLPAEAGSIFALGSEHAKAVVLTPENVTESVLFRATPGREFEYCFDNYSE